MYLGDTFFCTSRLTELRQILKNIPDARVAYNRHHFPYRRDSALFFGLGISARKGAFVDTFGARSCSPRASSVIDHIPPHYPLA